MRTGGMTGERMNSVAAGMSAEVEKSAKRGSTCEDKLIVDVSASANEADAVDAGKSMDERQSIGVSKLEIAGDLVDVVGGLTVEMELIGVRKFVVEDELLSMEESVGGERLTMFKRMSLDMIDVVDSVDIGAL